MRSHGRGVLSGYQARNACRRAGSGYVQEFQSADPNSSARYLLTISDRSAQAYVVTGGLLAKYEELGGPGSSLGFPAGDASTAGRQVFEGGALAGSPLRVVAGAILARWAAAAYESGPAGLPTGPAEAVTSFTGAAGFSQQFAGGIIASGPRGAFLVSGLIGERYAADAGPQGTLGLPVGDEFSAAGVRRQEFEGGYADLAGTSVSVVANEREPVVAANPAAVLPGGRVRLTVAGFRDNSTLRVTVQGQQDFVVETRSGAFTWESLVPASATPGVVRVRAVDTGAPTAVADGSYSVRSLAEARVQIAKVSGDTQTGAPGSVLPQPLRIQLKDEAGNPVSGVTIRFTAAPGATVSPASASTDIAGQAETWLKLPDHDGVALVTAEGARQVTTFSARAAGSAIVNFPRMTMSSAEMLGHGSVPISEGGALLASLAAMIRYYQNRGSSGTPNGLAEVVALNDFLRRTCVTDLQDQQFCDGFFTPAGSTAPIVNIWRLPRFVGGNLTVAIERPELNIIRALVAGGSPVLAALELKSDALRGSHFVVVTGVTADGALSISDPDTGSGRTRLSDYLDGFAANGQTWKAEVVGALRLVPGAASRTGFAVISQTPVAVASRGGECGVELRFPGPAVAPCRVRTGLSANCGSAIATGWRRSTR